MGHRPGPPQWLWEAQRKRLELSSWGKRVQEGQGEACTFSVAHRVQMGLASHGCRSWGCQGRPAGEGQRVGGLLMELWDSILQM